MQEWLTLNVFVDRDDLYEFAQFLKRSLFDDYRSRARNDDEARQMIAAVEALRRALAEIGIDPR